VFGCRAPDGTLVATAAALPYGTVTTPRAGWVSMVLVAREWQHRGLATLLMQRCIDVLRQAGIVPVLDATPAGEPVYARLGFTRGLNAARWEADLPAGLRASADEAVAVAVDAPMAVTNTDAFKPLDAVANGLGRDFLLDSFLAREGSCAWLSADGEGFVILRPGQRAMQLGPLVARNAAQAVQLLATALSQVRGRVFLDVLSRWPAVTQWLQAHGFVQQRPFVRMALGAMPVASDRLFVLAGPEFG
jgi:GNAT superfamily N-acetyltransferase